MSLRLRILQIDVPASTLELATAFWSGALGATPVTTDAGFVHLHDARSVVEVHLQPLDDGPARYHLDVEAAPEGPGRDAEVARLVDLGAIAGPASEHGYTVVHDPAGMPLCVIDPDAVAPDPLADRVPDRGHLDAIFLDVPAADVDAELAFWAEALGVEASPSQDEYVELAGVAGPGGAIDLEVHRIGGPARIHVDVSVDDVAAEVARLEALGAERIAAIESWVTLADPVGNLLCVVPSSVTAPANAMDTDEDET